MASRAFLAICTSEKFAVLRVSEGRRGLFSAELMKKMRLPVALVDQQYIEDLPVDVGVDEATCTYSSRYMACWFSTTCPRSNRYTVMPTAKTMVVMMLRRIDSPSLLVPVRHRASYTVDNLIPSYLVARCGLS